MAIDITAQEILASCAVAYATCRSYEDVGENTTAFVKGPRPWDRTTNILRFRTSFVRPDRIRFDYARVAVGPESEWMRGVYWSDGHRMRSWTTMEGVESEHPTLAQALAAPSAVSGGTSAGIPKLLMPELGGLDPLPQADRLRVVGSDTVDSCACFVVEGPYRDDMVRLSIDCESFLIRRRQEETTHTAARQARMIESMRAVLDRMPKDDPRRVSQEGSIRTLASMTSVEFTTHSTTVWQPVLNPEIDSDVFAYSPPTE